MIIDQINTIQDVEQCVDLYLSLSDDTWMTADRATSIRSLMDKVKRKKFVRVLREDSKIIAWIYADLVKLPHTDYVNFQQIYYASAETGVRAFRCVKLLHEAMTEFGETSEAKYYVSPGSPLDDNNVFAKILEKCGWIRKGYMAFRVVGPKTAPPGTQLEQPWRAFAR